MLEQYALSLRKNERKMKRLIFAVMLMSSIMPCTAMLPAQRHEAKVQYFPASTTLRGELRKENRFGPPGFGETPKTDAKVSIIVLVLKSPVTAVPSAGADADKTSNLDTVEGVSEIQLFFEGDDGPRLKARVEKMIGKAVTITGTLNEAIAAMDFTKLTMTVTAVEGK